MAEGKRIELSTLRWDGFQDHLCTLHPTLLLLWSEWQDSNLRPTDSKSATLPNCATLRNFIMVDPLGIEPRPDGLKDRCPNLLCEGSIICLYFRSSSSSRRDNLTIVSTNFQRCQTTKKGGIFVPPLESLF